MCQSEMQKSMFLDIFLNGQAPKRPKELIENNISAEVGNDVEKGAKLRICFESHF